MFALLSEQFRKIFGKWSEIFEKSSKTSSLVYLCNKQNITCPLVDMNFIFSCSTQYLTCSLRSLVRYRVEHSNIKFISTRGHVISSLSVAWSDWEYFYSPVDGMLVHRKVTPSIKFAGTHLYTWVEGGTVRVKCLAHATTQCPRPGIEPGGLQSRAR